MGLEPFRSRPSQNLAMSRKRRLGFRRVFVGSGPTCPLQPASIADCLLDPEELREAQEAALAVIVDVDPVLSAIIRAAAARARERDAVEAASYDDPARDGRDEPN